MDELAGTDPFHFTALAGSVFATALRQDAEAGARHQRTLDRLHLAALEDLGLSRLMTNDEAQAEAAREAGLKVIVPRESTN